MPAAAACSAIRSSPWMVTPCSRSAASAAGRNLSATSLCTRNVSAVLHTLVRCVLEFTRIATALSTSAEASTYTWQLPDAGLDHGDRGVVHHVADQARPSARDEQVDQPAGRHQGHDGLVAAPGHELDRVHGDVGAGQGGAHDVDEGGVGVVRRGRSAQECGVAALEAQPGGVHRDVGTGLVDHRHDTHGHAHLADLQPVRLGPATHDLPDGVGQVGDELQRVGDVGQPVPR